MTAINFIFPDIDRDVMLAGGFITRGHEFAPCAFNVDDVICFLAAPRPYWRVVQRLLILGAPEEPGKWYVRLERTEDPLIGP